MGRVRVRYNKLPKIIAAWPGDLEDGVDGTADDLATYLKPRVWRDTGVVMRTTVAKPEGALHAEVGVGHHLGKGFYARFWEWGTARPNAYGITIQPPKPVVGPAAHAHEPIFADNMTKAIRKAVSRG